MDTTFFSEMIMAIKAYGKAASLLFSRQFRWFLIFPFLITLSLFWGGHFLIGLLGGTLSGMLETAINNWVESISWLSWLGSSIGFLLRFLFHLFYLLIFIFWGGYLVMLLMSPVYSWLSEKTETCLSGKKYPFHIGRFLHEVGRGILVALGSMLLQTCLMLLLFICSFIPGIGLVTPLISFLVTAYFCGFAFIDYTMERKQLSIGEGIRRINRHKGAVLGIGIIFSLSLLIPFLRIFACSFVSMLSVIAGTLVVNEVVKEPKR